MIPFVGKSGSKVIITSRHLAPRFEHAFNFHTYWLQTLSNEDGWSLFSKHAFGSEDFHGGEYPALEAIGLRIARKCGGLPLGLIVLGGLLRSKVMQF